MKIIVFRPCNNSDEILICLHQYLDALLPTLIRKYGPNCIEISPICIAKISIEREIEKLNNYRGDKFFIFYGHGLSDSLLSAMKTKIIDLDNVHKLRKWYIYTVACFSTKILGKVSVISKNVKGYIGYRGEYAVVRKMGSVPAYFISSANAGLNKLAKGSTKALNMTIIFNDIIQQYDININSLIGIANIALKTIIEKEIVEIAENITESLSEIFLDLIWLQRNKNLLDCYPKLS